ncbi:MAG: hypothetical protein M3134_03355 [Actinomycetota bacterium]|nr:hypothetical protein [Actinomycetota bacterium]
MNPIRWLRDRHDALWDRYLVKPLRTDPASVERRRARMSDARLERFLIVGVVTTITFSVAVPVADIAESADVKSVAMLIAAAAATVTIAIMVILWRAGRP